MSAIFFLPLRKTAILFALWLLLTPGDTVHAADRPAQLPADVIPVLHRLLEMATADDVDFHPQRIAPLIDFLLSPKSPGNLYAADGSFGLPSAYNEFIVHAPLGKIIDYIFHADIPSFFFWPSSIRLSRWVRMDGGDDQLKRIRAHYGTPTTPTMPFILKGVERVTITPDQHTGAYYSYELGRVIILTAHAKGNAMISVSRQRGPSAVGKKGWVIGDDDDWSYLYTQDTGLNIKGLGWAATHMYDSSNVTIYYEAEGDVPVVLCGTVSWVKAGWAGINMVRPVHVYRGLRRVSTAFAAILENPRLPEPAVLAETFSNSAILSTPTLRQFVRDYYDHLKRRLMASGNLWKKVGPDFDSRRLSEQMTREELFAVLALDYFKKVLGRNPVMASHPF